MSTCQSPLSSSSFIVRVMLDSSTLTSPDGSVIYAAGAGGIVSLATSDLSLKSRFLEGVPVDAMAVTVDGGTIYALVRAGGRIVRLDAGSGRIVGEVPGSGYDRLAAVVPW